MEIICTSCKNSLDKYAITCILIVSHDMRNSQREEDACGRHSKIEGPNG